MRCLELRSGEGNRQDLDAGILRPTFLDLRSRDENHEIGQRPRRRAVAIPQCSHLRIAAIRRRHRGELRPVVQRGAVMEDDAGERMRKGADPFDGHARHLDDASHRVALASPLHPEEADRVGLVQVEGDLATAGLAKQSVLRRTACDAEEGVVFEAIPGQSRVGVPSRQIGLHRWFRDSRIRNRFTLDEGKAPLPLGEGFGVRE